IGLGSILSAPRRLEIGEDSYIGKFCTIQCEGTIGRSASYFSSQTTFAVVQALSAGGTKMPLDAFSGYSIYQSATGAGPGCSSNCFGSIALPNVAFPV